MQRIGSSARTAGFTLCSAMVAALLAGCSGQPSLASAGGSPVADASARETAEEPANTAVDKALLKAEARVAKSANNAAARAGLAQLYLAAGRFDSAATTFEDAVSLGDRAPRTGLGLALAYIGSGRNAQALDVLSQWRDRIPAGDLGLAAALAGQPAQGVAVLTDTLRGGQNDAKIRQNLAYAYALDGRWAESRVIAAQDVPADQLEARMGEWASRLQPDQAQARVATLLGAPLRGDPGQPTALALNGVDHAPRMAMAGTPAAPDPTAELPAVQAAETDWDSDRSIAAPVLAAAPVARTRAAQAAPAPARATERKAAHTTIERAFEKSAGAGQAHVGKAGHVVQLGSFATREGAQRAWGIFQRRDPKLRDRTLRITEAQVNGRRYYRVAAVGFDQDAAHTMCSTVRQRGGACFAYADEHRMPVGIASSNGSSRARN